MKTQEYAKAIQYYEECIKTCKDAKNATEATINEKLAEAYMKTENLDKALECDKKALEINIALYGKHHPYTASVYANLANVFSKQGSHEKALEYYSLASKISEKANDIKSADCNLSIGNEKCELGELEEALHYYLKGCGEAEEYYGLDHIQMANHYNSLGIIHQKLKNFKEAKKFLKKALECRRTVYGNKHPETLDSYDNFAMLFFLRQKFEKAEKWTKEALKLKEALYGVNHPEYARSCSTLSTIYTDKKQLEEAVECQKTALKILESHHGKNHPDVMHSFNALGLLYKERGKLAKDNGILKEGVQCCLNALEISKRIYKIDHPETARAYFILGEIFFSGEKYEGAKIHFEKALNLRKSFPEKNLENIVPCYKNIGLTYIGLNQLENALEYLSVGLEIWMTLGVKNHTEEADFYIDRGGL